MNRLRHRRRCGLHALVVVLCLAVCASRAARAEIFARKPLPPPPPCMPSEYAEHSAPAPGCDDAFIYWWQALNDPVLNGLINEAVCQNLTLREAVLRVTQFRSQYGVARGALFPRLAGTAGFSHKQTSVNGNQFVIPQNLQRSFDLYSAGFDSGWEVPLWGKYRNTLQAAGADLGASREAMRDVKVTLLADVAASYVSIRVLQQRLLVAQQNLRTQQTTVRLVESRLRAGLVGELDAAQARSNMHNTAAQIPPIEQQLRVALNGLCVLLGRLPSRAIDAQVGLLPIPVAPPELAVGMPAQLLRRRPDVRQAEFTILAESARVGIAKAELYPQFNLKGTLTLDSRSFNNWFTTGSLAYSFGPGIRWDILNFGKLRAAVRVRQAQFEQSVVKYQRAVLTAAAEVENGLVTFQQQQQRIVELEQAVRATAESARLSRASYTSGLVAFQTVLDSERQLLNLQEQLVDARGDLVLAAVQTYKAAGGGWQAGFRCPADHVMAPAAEALTPEGDSLPEVPVAPPAESAPAVEAVKPTEEVPAPKGEKEKQGPTDKAASPTLEPPPPAKQPPVKPAPEQPKQKPAPPRKPLKSVNKPEDRPLAKQSLSGSAPTARTSERFIKLPWPNIFARSGSDASVPAKATQPAKPAPPAIAAVKPGAAVSLFEAPPAVALARVEPTPPPALPPVASSNPLAKPQAKLARRPVVAQAPASPPPQPPRVTVPAPRAPQLVQQSPLPAAPRVVPAPVQPGAPVSLFGPTAYTASAGRGTLR